MATFATAGGTAATDVPDMYCSVQEAAIAYSLTDWHIYNINKIIK
jgi:hypothetical protein